LVLGNCCKVFHWAHILEEHVGRRRQVEVENGLASEQPSSEFTGHHIVFTTSKTYRPGGTGTLQFNSTAAADAICQEHANSVQLNGRFIAFLSGNNASIRDRFQIFGPVYLPKGELVTDIERLRINDFPFKVISYIVP